ncbi:hypothetical protein [Methylobacterium sp. GC_Met_1]|uniref:hypothetical protein n=1 Tax=Methylobacterium sp. GC_Met_1 TaxID=2937377 RepID=UPI002269E0C3|nr:hypothetical protein [Methylobacterium sp. GC_Met_1]
MTQPPAPRVRKRTWLYDFAPGCKIGVGPQQGWIDRLKFGLPGINVPCACAHGDLKAYLGRRSREYDDPFEVEQLPNRSLRVTFPAKRWLFNLQITISLRDGLWSGAGALELNTTRLFASVDEARNLAASPEVNRIDLMRPHGLNPIRALTLDGNDNFVPDRLIPMAVQADWSRLTQSYAAAVLDVVTEAVGTLHDLELKNKSHEPLLRLPPLERWTLKHAEVYAEFKDANAPLRVAEIAEHGRSLSPLFAVENHGKSPTHGMSRNGNMPAMKIGLGAAGVDLSIYAKAHDRLRVEARYTRAPLKACRLTKEHYSGSSAFVAEVLVGIRENAVARITQFLEAYEKSRGSAAPRLTALVSLLSAVSRACGSDLRLMNRVLSLLIVHNGLSRTSDQRLQEIADILIQSGFLRQSRATLRSRRTEYVLAPYYGAALASLRALPKQ